MIVETGTMIFTK